ncbi:elongation of very long chain fatty acids protein 1-like isoform X2 [Diabrotica virgifera virgifera]|uniref:Elongation of very long chain fatty acids protein n=1 Tax=Diabrotica virgifera virgifera TaxID=50390 RepID=A0ABM5L099_DIAVI|nr:elongation of very long chain fatty acids protein 1-like isoform X2 [Diabrotica virgifera virgifera]
MGENRSRRSILNPRHDAYITASPYFLYGFLFTYIFTIKILGPKLMRYRQPYNIKNLLIGYNFIQILLNTYIVYEAIIVYFSNSNWICIDTTEKNILADARKHYYFLKILDCVETVFFILRKKYQQASFLHIYHHTGILCAAFLAFRYDYGDTTWIIGGLNSLTHVFMYVYYLLSAINSRWSKYTTIKKSLTLLQIVQLNVILFSLAITKLIPECYSVPTYSLVIWIFQNVFMINLFVRFYIKSYVNNQKSVGKKK